MTPERRGIDVTIGRQGRLVVPAPLRRHLGLEEGEILVATADDDRLVLERRRSILARLQRRFTVVPAEISLVDELLAERREETRRERGS